MPLPDVFIVGLIFACFAFIHSLLAAQAVKTAFARLLGERFMKTFYRFFYTCASVATFMTAAALFSSIPDIQLFTPPLLLMATMRAVQFAGAVFGAFAFKKIDLMEFSGIAQVLRHARGDAAIADAEGIRNTGLVKDGVYGLVRHPLYLAGIIIVSFSPTFTRNWIVVSVLADLYFIFGALIEEKRYMRQYGEEYRQYMKEVPMLFPRTKQCAQKC